MLGLGLSCVDVCRFGVIDKKDLGDENVYCVHMCVLPLKRVVI